MRLHIPPTLLQRIRLTVPAREALEKAGNVCKSLDDGTWDVTLLAPPGGLELVRLQRWDSAEEQMALRLTQEPSYPGEGPAKSVAWHQRGELVPCPECGAGLVWYEAGYVPGTRVCLKGHGAQLSPDGRTAHPMPVSVP